MAGGTFADGCDTGRAFHCALHDAFVQLVPSDSAGSTIDPVNLEWVFVKDIEMVQQGARADGLARASPLAR